MRFVFTTYISFPSLVVAAKGFMGKVKTGDGNLAFPRILEEGKAQ